jgi:hypothetical protein
MIVGNTTKGNALGHINLLPIVLSAFSPQNGGLILVLMFMCVLISPCLPLIRPEVAPSRGNELHANVLGLGTIDLKFINLGMIMQLKKAMHVPSIKKNLVVAPVY